MSERAAKPTKPSSDNPHHDELEEYAGGYITAWHGRIPAWLLVVYAVLFVFGLYYAYLYWGSLGPGRVY